MSNACYSCGMPLLEEHTHGNYCQYCVDPRGKVYSREVVQKGIAAWLAGWAPEGTGDENEFLKRADSYMKAMPAWAE